MLAAAFPITVEGSGLVSGTVILWNGEAIATTWLDDEHLRAQVPAAKVSTAGNVAITTRSPAPGNFVSNQLPFVVEAPVPTITGLSPSNAPAPSEPPATSKSPAATDAFLLTITGTNFANDAKVLWDGQELTPQSVTSTQITVQISDALLVTGGTVGVVVSNPTPSVQNSAPAIFTITVPMRLMIPNISKAE
jgi:hypothetical protein